jgi:hypothetical protein
VSIHRIRGGRVGAPPDIAYREATAEHLLGRAGSRQFGMVIDFKSPQAYLAIGPTCASYRKMRSVWTASSQ